MNSYRILVFILFLSFLACTVGVWTGRKISGSVAVVAINAVLFFLSRRAWVPNVRSSLTRALV